MKRSNVIATAIIVASISVISGCAVNKTLSATGGSRSDGFIEFSYAIGSFEKPVVDWDGALKTAIRRCQAWDYTGAESFGVIKKECDNMDSYGRCSRSRAIIKYQCTK